MQPSNFNLQLLNRLDWILVGAGGAGGDRTFAPFQPQPFPGDPNGALTPRYERDLAIDTLSNRVYYAAGSEWLILAKDPEHSIQ